MPLETQTVRFIDNFSAGTRGATSAEFFLEEGYAVIFMHRQFSLQPYSRHYSHTRNCFLEFMEADDEGIHGMTLPLVFLLGQQEKMMSGLFFFEFGVLGGTSRGQYAYQIIFFSILCRD